MAGKLNTSSLSMRAQREIMGIIKGMDLASDNKLPREEALAEQLGVSRTTIRQALNNLAAEGIVFRRQGRGTFVNVDSLGVRATFSPCMELVEAIRSSGYEPSVETLSVRRIEPAEAGDLHAALGLAADEPVIEVDKCFRADGRPCAFCRDHLGLSALGGQEGLEALPAFGDSIFKFVLERSGRRVEWDHAELDVATAADLRSLGEDFARQQVGERPYLLVHTTSYDRDDRALLVAREYVNPAVIRYDLIRRKSIDFDCGRAR